MAWEVFDKRAAGRSRVPTITIQKRGTFSLNAGAAHLLAGSDQDADGLAVELLFDREGQVVGIRRVTKEHLSVYVLRKQKNSDSYLLGGKAFTQYYGIDTTASKRYPAKSFGDGFIGAELRGEFTEVTREREDEEAGADAEDLEE